MRRSTGAEPDATRLHRVEETPALPASVPLTILAIPWPILIKSPSFWLCALAGLRTGPSFMRRRYPLSRC